jgi:hypothetical protein
MEEARRSTMRRAWLRTGFATILIFAVGSLSRAQQDPQEAPFRRESELLGKALSNCLSRHTRRLANGKTPTQADGDAAVSMCASEEAAYRKLLLKMPGLENGVIPSGAYAGISIDLVVICTRQHIVWEMVGFDQNLRRDESVPIYKVDSRCR